MAVVPDRRIEMVQKLTNLRTNKAIVTEALEKRLVTEGHSLHISPKVEPSPLDVKPELNGSAEHSLIDLTESQVNCSEFQMMSTDAIKSEPGISKIDADDEMKKVENPEHILRRLSMQSQMDSSNDMCINGEKSEVSSSENRALDSETLRELLETVETGISMTEQQLIEQIEKRKKFKADDARRTHNYDPFILTFLFMLTQQRLLDELLPQARRSYNTVNQTNGRVRRLSTKKPQKANGIGNRRRGRKKGTKKK